MHIRSEETIASLVVEFYHWLAGHGGREPSELLAEVDSASQRRELTQSFDDVLSVWSVTSPIRASAVRRAMSLLPAENE